MKKITRRKIEKIIEYCYFKNLSCRATSKLLKISKTTTSDYYHKFLWSNLKYSDLILMPNKIFNDVFYERYSKKSDNRRKTELYQLFPIMYKEDSNNTHIDYWKEYKTLVRNPYGNTQFTLYFNDWLEENNYEIIYNLLTLNELTTQDFKILKKYKKSKNRNDWRKAKAIMDVYKGKSKVTIAKNVEVSLKTLKKWIKIVNSKGMEELFKKKKRKTNQAIKAKIRLKKNRIIEILHQPPHLFGINRTSWDQSSISKIYEKTYNEKISTTSISTYLKEEGYVFKKARKVLTSTDPNYREKLAKITNILRNLKSNEKFFSIDEYGPFAIKIQGGRSYSLNDELKTFPQLQKSKGSLILTAALELSTNQTTFFYSNKKNTDEMIKLMHILLAEYKNEKNIYLSWDSASWHISKKLLNEIKLLNLKKAFPKVYLAPLPSCAQFLNVIESVFSGMARAIIHNSNYQSIDECKLAINRYFEDRNEYFRKNPKKAGKKIWGKEVVPSSFSKTNNCKDPRYR